MCASEMFATIWTTAKRWVRRLGVAWRSRKPGWAVVAGERFLLRYPFSRFDPASERPVLDAFAAAVAPGMLVFDVGANAGIYTLVASRRGARTVAFEPSRKAAQLLEEHLALNQLEADVVQAVVVDHDGEVSFFEQGSANTSSISEASARTGEGLTEGEVVEVARPAVSLDSYCAGSGLWPDVVKLDVEGAEALALAGASAWLGRRRGVLFLELHPWSLAQLGQSERDVFELLDSSGWTWLLIEDNGNTRHYQVFPGPPSLCSAK